MTDEENSPNTSAPMSYEDILEVVTAFYQKATQDVFIGYHFRNIQDFATHIPRIADFWELQLLGTCRHPESLPFDLFNVHIPLQIRRPQVGRWIILFKETLQDFRQLYQKASPQKLPYLDLWESKVGHFQHKFLQNQRLYEWSN